MKIKIHRTTEIEGTRNENIPLLLSRYVYQYVGKQNERVGR
jgi:hypothetical protein